MEIQELLNDCQSTMTQFQHDHFVTGKAGTPYAQYMQAVRELNTRINSLRDGYADYEILLIDIDEQEYLSQNEENSYAKRRAVIEHRRRLRGVTDKEREIKGIESEALSFYRQAIQLKKIVGELTPEKEEKYTEEMWEYKVKFMAALEIMTSGRPSRGTLETVIALKGDLRTTILEALNKPDDLVKEIENKSEEYTQLINGSTVEQLDFKTLLLEDK